MDTQTPITVVIARFADLLARGLRGLIEDDPRFSLLAADIEPERIDVVLRARRPCVAILDLAGLQRPAAMRELSARNPATHFVLLSDRVAAADCAQLLAFGASACLATDTQSRDIVNAIHLAARGLQLIPRAASETGGAPVGSTGLTQREAEVLMLLRQSRANAQIAAELGIGVETVRTHARNIYRKLGVASRRDLLDQAPWVEERATPAARAPARAMAARRRRGLPHP
jgi:DNA-binding NarL/FixJ family response regulator